MSRHILPILLALLVCASWASVAQAADILVPDDKGVIQAAIDSATAGSDRVVITKVNPELGSGGVYSSFRLNKNVPVLKADTTSVTIEVLPGSKITVGSGSVSGLKFVAASAFSSLVDSCLGTISNCTFTDSGHDFSTAAVRLHGGGRIENCTFTLTSGEGRAVAVNGSGAVILGNQIDITLTSGGSMKEGIHLAAGATDIDGNTITFSGSDALNGVGIAATAGGGGSTIEDNTLIGGGTGVYLSLPASGLTIQRNTFEDYTLAVKLFQGTGTTVNQNTIVRNTCSGSSIGIRVDFTYGTGYSAFTNNLFHNVGTGMSFGGSVSGSWTISHNVYDSASDSCATKDNKGLSQTAISDTVDVLFCEGREAPVGEWTQRIDSEAARGNNPWGEQVGAYGVECAWGTLASDATLLAGESAYVLEDVEVPSGKTLTMGAGSTLMFDGDDESNTGFLGFTGLNELRVSGGELKVVGTGGNRAQFVSSAASPQEGDWLGLYIDEDSVVDVDYADFQHAEYAVIFSSSGSLSLDECTFSDNAGDDIHIGGTGTATISNSTITVGSGNGLAVDGASSVTAYRNTLTADDNTVNAIRLNDTTENDPSLTFDENTIQGTDSGVGVKVQSKDPSFVKNTVRDFQWGFHITGGGPVIGDAADSLSDNIITSNTRGVYFNCGSGPTCGACADTAYVRNSSMTSNSTGVYVDKRGFIDLGNATSYGKNTFSSNSLYCIRASSCDTVRAVGNWFGAYPPTPCWTGPVDVSNLLQAAPASRPAIHIVAMDPATGLRILAAVPNPTRGTTTLRLETAGGHATIGVEVYDVTGRLVRRLAYQAPMPGIHEVRWDGRDGAGRPVPSGLYFIRTSAGIGLEARTKILVTR